jgi:CRISPR/Cas system-associated exonuclease Cas4 (RecB family)
LASDSALKRLANLSKPGQWLIAALEGAQAYSGEGRNDPGWFHPSTFGNECDAFLAFRYLGAPAQEIILPRQQRIFDFGNIEDLHLKRYMAKAGVSLIKKEAERNIELPLLHIRGELDDWVANPITKRRYVVDYKTMHSEAWKNLDTVVVSHHLQIHPYMFAKETYEGFVIYENKDNQELKCLKANFENDLWQTKIVQRIESILENLDKDLVNRNPVNCSRCPFFANGVCTSNQIAKLKEKSGLYAG